MSRKGFTLIELLVVISIIGLLSSVVLASLNSARTKGSIAAIKGNLRNMIAAAELSYDSVIPNSYINACTGVLGMTTAIGKIGGVASCYSYDNARWGASAKLNSDTSKNYSVDSSAVVTWDTVDTGGGVAMNWATAVSSCATAGGRLPTIEQLKALSLAYSSVTPQSFQASSYWSGTEDSAISSWAYYVNMITGVVANNNKIVGFYARCVR
jgi:prepilin-type N-terminal cleavage/methylation domain-containing protein